MALPGLSTLRNHSGRGLSADSGTAGEVPETGLSGPKGGHPTSGPDAGAPAPGKAVLCSRRRCLRWAYITPMRTTNSVRSAAPITQRCAASQGLMPSPCCRVVRARSWLGVPPCDLTGLEQRLQDARGRRCPRFCQRVHAIGQVEALAAGRAVPPAAALHAHRSATPRALD